MDRFEDRINDLWIELYLPKWTHRLACLIWGHCGIKTPSGNYCAYCQKDQPEGACS
jgi:hypothetical protein